MSTFAVTSKSSRKSFRLVGTTANSGLNLLLFAASLVWAPYATPKQKTQTPAPQARESRPAEDADKGKRLYVKYGCYECHGYQGQGSTAAGPRIAPSPIPRDAFVGYVRQPSGEMPPYTERVISDAELADIRAFLATIPKGPNSSEISLLK
jgi:Cytochrome C oxidase, cbb3-type, subunit III